MVTVKNKFLGIMCFACLLVCMAFSFTGCKNANAVYSDFIEQMDAMISANTDIFSDRSINITYSDEIEKIIHTNTNYAKLCHQSGVTEGVTHRALFEPVLAASMEVVLNYYDKVNMSKLGVSTNSAEQIVEDLKNFRANLQTFVNTKHTLDARKGITDINAVIKKELDELCVNYKNLINSAVVFGKDFVNVYKNEIFEKESYKNGRYPLGEMKLTYLDELNTFSEFDAKTVVRNFYDKNFETNTITNSERLFVAYLDVKEYSNWEELTSTISDNEKECIKTYTSLLNYKPIFDDKFSIADYAVSCIKLEDLYKFNSGSYKSTDFDNSTRTSITQINQFVNTYAQNYANYLVTLTQNIKTLKTN